MKTGPKPRKITTQLLEQIEFQASRGLSQQQICHALGISETWWYDAKQKIAEISESFKRGKAKGLAEVSNEILIQHWFLEWPNGSKDAVLSAMLMDNRKAKKIELVSTPIHL